MSNYNLESNISCVCLTYRCNVCYELLDNCCCDCEDCWQLLDKCTCKCDVCYEMLKDCECKCNNCGTLACIFTCEYCDKQYIGICSSSDFIKSPEF